MDYNIKSFMNYVKSYDISDYDISYKYFHSFRVRAISHAISKKLNWNTHDIYLATVIGLIHDIGRFEQLKNYHTYQDGKSIDHGDYGIKVLLDDQMIKKFDIAKEDEDTVLFCVKNHNKIQIESTNVTDCIKQAKLIRDADKIDILNAYTDLNAYQITNKLNEISETVEKQFFLKKTIHTQDIETTADELIFTLSYIFDLNYKESIKWILKRKYIEKLYNKIDNKEKYKKYFDFIFKYLKERVI